MRAALYLRTSSIESTVENQRRELVRVALQRGWTVIGEYTDEGISGAEHREKRPGLDSAMLHAASCKYDVLMAWSVDRLGRSLRDLLDTMQTLKASKINLYLHTQSLDTSTPAGAAMFGMLGVFAEFERAIICERIKAGMERARSQGKRVGAGKPPIASAKREVVEAMLKQGGMSIRQVAVKAKVSVGMVHKIKSTLF